MAGLIGKKLGMTSFFDEDGRNVPCTVVEAGPCYVTQVKTEEKDGYTAVQLGFDEKKEKNTTKPLLGHFKKAKVEPLRKLVEFRDFEGDVKVGDELTAELFEAGELVDVTGTTKGRGFQGVVKRHGFAGVGERTHGQHNRERAPGSIGGASFPSRVFKGMRMAGRKGSDRRKIFDLQVVKVDKDRNIMFIKGSVPGSNGSYVIIEK